MAYGSQPEMAAKILPEGYKAPEMQNLKPNADGDLLLTSGSSYGRPTTILFTTQPPNVKDDDPDGQSECYMSPATKQLLLATKNYPQPILQYSSPAFRIGPAGKCGLGMFATRTIRNGEYICIERPIMVMPAGTTIFGEVSRELSVNMTYGSMQQIMLAERELAHEVMFKRLKPKQQEEYMSLANCHLHDGSGPLTGILRTNGLALGNVLHHEVQGQKIPFSGVPYNISRLNHSCRQNTTWGFDMASFSYNLRAVREIKEGEELFISYTDDGTTAERQEQLAPYGFQCTCDSCTDPKSDERRAKIRPPRTTVFDPSIPRKPPISANPMANLDLLRPHLDSYIKECLSQLALIEKEGMWAWKEYRQHHQALMSINMLLKNKAQQAYHLSKLPREDEMFGDEVAGMVFA
ncbi:SET domain-containing protein [Stereum hirsutum FP-91666 SS1]|uniref:SET domain-containing protein n=1 Tax=Stereum hirsutum (strain FP-91666) TaxID=721885 RepID=UPI000440E710|nr:SET domain-containing protein [Stereum hirsutum FP-91666 SS1]EIM92660.1 SET domain-containing protein [Stereum hirsutum FP-91666 SS1]